MLAHPDSIMAKRAQFAQHHVWVTKYKDGELWAGGEFTNQSQREVNGVSDAVAREEDVENSDVVVWHTFGLTVCILLYSFPIFLKPKQKSKPKPKPK
jgi:primary-amine oxidase